MIVKGYRNIMEVLVEHNWKLLVVLGCLYSYVWVDKAALFSSEGIPLLRPLHWLLILLRVQV